MVATAIASEVRHSLTVRSVAATKSEAGTRGPAYISPASLTLINRDVSVATEVHPSRRTAS